MDEIQSDEDETVALEASPSTHSPAILAEHSRRFPEAGSASTSAPQPNAKNEDVVSEPQPVSANASAAPSLASESNDASANASPALRPCSPYGGDAAAAQPAEDDESCERQPLVPLGMSVGGQCHQLEFLSTMAAGAAPNTAGGGG